MSTSSQVVRWAVSGPSVVRGLPTRTGGLGGPVVPHPKGDHRYHHRGARWITSKTAQVVRITEYVR
jgi:hypothetical protein